MGIIGQSIQITIIGMSVVFIVLALLAILLRLQGMFFESLEKNKVEKSVPEAKQKTTPNKDVNVAKPSSTPSNRKVAAAISAAITMYNEQKNNKNSNS